MPKDFSACSASSAFKRPIFAGCEGETTTPGMPGFSEPRFQCAFLTRNLQQHRIELHERPLHRSFFGVALNTLTASEGIPGKRFRRGGSTVEPEECPSVRKSRILYVGFKSGEGGLELTCSVGGKISRHAVGAACLEDEYRSVRPFTGLDEAAI